MLCAGTGCLRHELLLLLGLYQVYFAINTSKRLRMFKMCWLYVLFCTTLGYLPCPCLRLRR